jgi:hypothetical protein
MQKIWDVFFHFVAHGDLYVSVHSLFLSLSLSLSLSLCVCVRVRVCVCVTFLNKKEMVCHLLGL